MRIFPVSDISYIEKSAVDNLGIPEILLMENAASAVFNAVTNLKPSPGNIAILCGVGNNGGDGFACARKFIAHGIKTTVFFFNAVDKFTPATLLNYNILKNLNADLVPFGNIYDFSEFDLVIDALLGTGTNRPLQGEYKTIIDSVNKSQAYKVAVDIPSGLYADKCSVNETVFKADLTITFIAPKICQTLYPSKEYCGKIIMDNLAIPKNIYPEKPYITLSSKATLPNIKKRQRDTHKGSYGHVLTVGGSQGMGGAVYMASVAALRIGAGLVSAIFPYECGMYFSSSPEIMAHPINCGSYFTETDAENIASLICNKNISVVCLGNGLGRNENTVAFVKKLIRLTDKPFVIDADGINALDDSDLEVLRGRAVITPHLGEFSRLIKTTVENIKYNRPECAVSFALDYGITLALKSAEIIIASPKGKVIVSDYGTATLAKGGSGDCFAGITAGFIAQGYTMEDSAELASYILGQSGCWAENNLNENTVTATDVIKYFYRSLNEL
ncbi:MAG: NAD(P)H-hydrate dehydratase [Deferribacterales bacterium]|nr:NAD(P)H-hydrate dehydratase [Deferribacterales bacterium]